MLRIIFEDQDKRTRSVLRSFCTMLRRVLKDGVVAVRDPIRCYLIRGVVAEIRDDIFSVWCETRRGDRILLGMVSSKRAFTAEIVDRYLQLGRDNMI